MDPYEVDVRGDLPDHSTFYPSCSAIPEGNSRKEIQRIPCSAVGCGGVLAVVA